MIKAPCYKFIMIKAHKLDFSVCKICKMRKLHLESKMDEEFNGSKSSNKFEKSTSQKAHVLCGLALLRSKSLPRMGWGQRCPNTKKQKACVNESRFEGSWAKGLSELRHICTVESVEALESFKMTIKYYSNFPRRSNFKEEADLWKISNKGKEKRERAKKAVESDAMDQLQKRGVDHSYLMENKKAICFALGRSLSFPHSNHDAVNACKLKSTSSMDEKHPFSSASHSWAPKFCRAPKFCLEQEMGRKSEERFTTQQQKEIDPDSPITTSSQNMRFGSYLEFEIRQGKLIECQKQELTAEETKCIEEELHAREIFTPSKSKPTHLQTIAKSNGYINPAALGSILTEPSSEFVKQSCSFDKLTSECQILPALIQTRSTEIATVLNNRPMKTCFSECLQVTPCSAKDSSKESHPELSCRVSNQDKVLNNSIESFTTTLSAFEAANRASTLLYPIANFMSSSINQTPLPSPYLSQVASSPESTKSISWPKHIESPMRSPPHNHVMRRFEGTFEKCKISLEIQKAVVTSPSKVSRGNGISLDDMDCSATQGSSKLVESAAYRHGNLQCRANEGLLWFSFYLDGSEEVLMAKTTKLYIDGCKQMDEPLIRFFSFKKKTKARAGWKSWLSKKKDMINNLGSMEITSRFLSEINPHGKEEKALEFQFVLLSDSAKTSASSSEVPTTHVPYSGPWDRITGGSALLIQKSLSCPGSPTFYKSSLPENAVDPEMTFLEKKKRMVDAKLQLCSNFSKVSSHGIPSSARYESYDAHNNVKVMGRRFCEENDPGIYLKKELFAMVLRVPIKKQSRTTGLRCKTHPSAKCDLGIESRQNSDFYFKARSLCQSHQTSRQRTNSQPEIESQKGSLAYMQNSVPDELISKRTYQAQAFSQNSKLTFKSLEYQNRLKPFEDFGNLEGYISDADNRYVTLTVILPAGEHGCPGWGSEGPQPLIQRWRSGGKCDCGSWDLGCGLILLSNEQAQNKISKSGSTQNKLQQEMQEDIHLEMLVQGKKQMVAMSLSHLKGDHVSLNFREPLSSLQAFATAVAVYYGKLDTTLLTSKMTKYKDFKAKPPHAANSTYNWGMSDPVINGRFHRSSFTPYNQGSHGDSSRNTVERI